MGGRRGARAAAAGAADGEAWKSDVVAGCAAAGAPRDGFVGSVGIIARSLGFRCFRLWNMCAWPWLSGFDWVWGFSHLPPPPTQVTRTTRVPGSTPRYRANFAGSSTSASRCSFCADLGHPRCALTKIQPPRDRAYEPPLDRRDRPSDDYIIRSRHGTSPENPQYPSKTGV